MPEAVIIYQSKKGKTERYAHAIAKFLKAFYSEVKVFSVFDFNSQDLKDTTVLFLGCWTRGRFLMGQKPQKEWIDLVEKSTNRRFERIVLFTTYNIAVGVMFKNMVSHIICKPVQDVLFIKSRNGKLSAIDKTKIMTYCTFQKL
jgi:hypothetical protein